MVEKNVQDSRRRIWQETGTRHFGSFVERNVCFGERCRALWSEISHPEHKQFSVAEMLTQEQPHLMPMPEPFDGYVESPAPVSSTCIFSANRNRYSVACGWSGKHDLVSCNEPGRCLCHGPSSALANARRI